MRVAFLFDWKSPEGRLDGTGIGSWRNKVLSGLCKDAGLVPSKILFALPKWLPFSERSKFFKNDPANLALLLRPQLKDIDAVVAFGPIATFISTGKSLEKFKGTHITDHLLGPNIKHVIPSPGPDVFSESMWKERINAFVALQKVQREVDKTNGLIHIPENVKDIEDYLDALPARTNAVAFDVETLFGQINEFSVSPNANECLYVPIFTASANAWSAEDEARIWIALHKLTVSGISFTFHNAVYDLTYLDHHGIHPLGQVDDTMLMAHALNPEWKKSLGYQAAVNLNVPAWKHLRVKAKKAVNKRGEE